MNWKDYLALGWLLFSCVTCTGIGIYILAWLWAQWRMDRHNRTFICPPSRKKANASPTSFSTPTTNSTNT